MDWLDLPAVQGTLKSLLQHHISKASILRHSAFFTVRLSSERQRLSTEIEQLTRKHEISAAEMTSLTADHDEAEAKNRTAAENLKAKTEEYDKIASDTSGFNKIIDEGNDRLFALHSEAAAKKSEAKSLENYRETLTERQKEIEKEKQNLSDQLKDEDARLRSFDESLQQARPPCPSQTPGVHSNSRPSSR